MNQLRGNQSVQILILVLKSILFLDLKTKLANNGYEIQEPDAHRQNRFLDPVVAFQEDVQRVLSISNSTIPHLMIIDSENLPTADFEKLKKQCRKKKIPVIYITEEIDDKIINEREKNVLGIFVKPFKSDTLVELINEYFKTK